MTTLRLDTADAVHHPKSSVKPNDPRTSALYWWRATQIVLVMWGDNRTPYVYMGVDESLWNGWCEAPSSGRFINSVLVDAGIRYAPCTDEIL